MIIIFYRSKEKITGTLSGKAGGRSGYNRSVQRIRSGRNVDLGLSWVTAGTPKSDKAGM